MPQMAPMNWLSLFFTFTIIFLLFNSVNYFSFLYKSDSNKKLKSSSQISWKW